MSTTYNDSILLKSFSYDANLWQKKQKQEVYYNKEPTSLKQKKSIKPTSPRAWSRPICLVPYNLLISDLLSWIP